MRTHPLGPSVELPGGHETREGCAEIGAGTPCGRTRWGHMWSHNEGVPPVLISVLVNFQRAFAVAPSALPGWCGASIYRRIPPPGAVAPMRLRNFCLSVRPLPGAVAPSAWLHWWRPSMYLSVPRLVAVERAQICMRSLLSAHLSNQPHAPSHQLVLAFMRPCVICHPAQAVFSMGFDAGSVSSGSVGSVRMLARACWSVVRFRGFGFGSVRFRVAPRGIQ